MLRALIVGLCALLLAGHVVRVAAVSAFARNQPAIAERLWPGNPEAEIPLDMTEIAQAARAGRRVSPEIFGRIFAMSARAPLAEEPFLVRGVQAQLAGDQKLAGRAFTAAKWRNGRSLPARYFLADYYLRRGDARRGLAEVAVLARLVPDGVTSLGPYVASYALQPRNRAQVRALLHDQPNLEDATLAALARDPGNADLVLALADPQRRNASSVWLPGLLTSLVSAGEFTKAREAWADVSDVRLAPETLIFDPEFKQEVPPPPFNWTLTNSTVGLAERVRGGGLHLIYYGHEDGPLARQLLVLPAGSYRLAMRPTGDPDAASRLRWRVVCARSGKEIDTAPLSSAAGSGWAFTVPAGCEGQWLELIGVAADLPETSDVTLRALSLTRVAGR
jgi:hypothetical protein